MDSVFLNFQKHIYHTYWKARAIATIRLCLRPESLLSYCERYAVLCGVLNKSVFEGGLGYIPGPALKR